MSEIPAYILASTLTASDVEALWRRLPAPDRERLKALYLAAQTEPHSFRLSFVRSAKAALAAPESEAAGTAEAPAGHPA